VLKVLKVAEEHPRFQLDQVVQTLC